MIMAVSLQPAYLTPVLPPVVAQGGCLRVAGDVLPGEALQPLILLPGILGTGVNILKMIFID